MENGEWEKKRKKGKKKCLKYLKYLKSQIPITELIGIV